MRATGNEQRRTTTALLRRAARDLRDYGPAAIPSRWGPARRFVVLGTGRSGSRLLTSLLDRQPGVRCEGEILNPGQNRIRYPYRWVQSHAMRAGLRGARAYGFKLLVHHFRDLPLVDGGKEFVSRLNRAGYFVVVLTRRNLLRQAVSWERAQLVGQHHYKLGETTERPPVHLDPIQLILRMALLELENDYAKAAAETLPHLDVSYEDDLVDPFGHQPTVDRIMAALEMPSGPIKTPLRRGSTDDLNEQLTNWDEVADVIGRTRYAKFLLD